PSLPALFSVLFLQSPPPLHHPPSFPTRRSSDLIFKLPDFLLPVLNLGLQFLAFFFSRFRHGWSLLSTCRHRKRTVDFLGCPFDRSEEHTSELQSRFDLVCRLLLEKQIYPIVSES